LSKIFNFALARFSLFPFQNLITTFAWIIW